MFDIIVTWSQTPCAVITNPSLGNPGYQGVNDVTVIWVCVADFSTIHVEFFLLQS